LRPSRATVLVVGAGLGGLLLGAAVPAARHLSPFALVAVFVQTLFAVGALIGPQPERVGSRLRRSVGMLLLHHGVTSLPLIGLGLVLGLDTPLGAGTFVLGAVPPAAGLPSFAAACGVPVHRVLPYCLLAYTVGLVATPLLVLVGLGSTEAVGRLVLTLVMGLIAPCVLARLGSRWLSRVDDRIAFGVVASSIAVLALGLGPSLGQAVSEGAEHTELLLAAVAIAAGRTAFGAGACALVAPRGQRRELALVGTYKNAALAAILALGSAGPLAALPALLSMFCEAAVLLLLGRVGVARTVERPHERVIP
jgi:predicted Na+-dependent transporter